MTLGSFDLFYPKGMFVLFIGCISTWLAKFHFCPWDVLVGNGSRDSSPPAQNDIAQDFLRREREVELCSSQVPVDVLLHPMLFA